MLAAVAAVVAWIGWPTSNDQVADPGLLASQTQPASNEPSVKVGVESKPIPTPAEPATGGTSVRANKTGQTVRTAKLDLNRATVEDLRRLPGIGEVLAKRVVEWRGAHGSFQTVDQLTDVKGIGEKKLERLRPLVTVSRPPNAHGAAIRRVMPIDPQGKRQL
jgi:competence protein ComEA